MAEATRRDWLALVTAIAPVAPSSRVGDVRRVVVQSGGFEHTSSQVYFQWLVRDRESEAGSRLVSSRVVEEFSGGFYSVGQPLIERAAGRFRVVVAATSTYEPTRTATFTFLTQKPGEYRLEKKSGL